MKLGPLAVVAGALAVGAFVFWIWTGSDTDVPSPSETGSAAVSVPPSRPAAAPVPLAPGAVPLSTGSSAIAPKSPGADQPAAPVRVTSSVVPGMPVTRTSPTAPQPVPPVPAPSRPSLPPEPEREGRAEVEAVQFMLRDFRTRMGENPVGSNAEIMRAVMGGNPAKARLGPPEGQGLNEQGELIDKWGTPYFFHQMAKDNTEIRSAGPDMKMWTSDDVVAQ